MSSTAWGLVGAAGCLLVYGSVIGLVIAASSHDRRQKHLREQEEARDVRA